MADSNQFSKALTPEFYLEVAKGSVKNHGHFVLGLCNQEVGTTEESVWQFGGIQNYSLAPGVEMFVSSSSAADVNQLIAVTIIDVDGNLVTRSVVTNGQTAVSAGICYRVLQMRNLGFFVVSGGDLAGDLYIAESDVLVAGVPSTPTLIRNVIMFDTLAVRSPNVSLGAGFTVPSEHFAIIRSIKFAAPNAKDVVFSVLIRPNNDTGTLIRPFQDAAPFNLFQAAQNLDFEGIFVDALWDLEIRARTASGATAFVTVIIEFTLIARDN